MSIFQKFKDWVGIEDIDEDDLDDGTDDGSRSIVPAEKGPEIRPMAASASSSPAAPVKPSSQSAPVKSAAPTSRFTSKDMKLMVMEPQSFDESPRLVDSLKAKKPVIINLENLETDTARKIFDFLSGATYALNGNVQKVANNIFVFAPENVDISYNNGTKASEQPPVKNPWK